MKEEIMNKINVSSIAINISLLDDKEKLFELIKENIIKRRKVLTDFMPKSLDVLSTDKRNFMLFIDDLYQKNIISRDIVIEIITEIVERETTGNRFKAYADDLYLTWMEKLNRTLLIKYKDLLGALNDGSISYEEFERRYGKLKELSNNSLKEINDKQDILRKKRR